nr:hypothetical protein CFP56_20521 [Quercus suber]
MLLICIHDDLNVAYHDKGRDIECCRETWTERQENAVLLASSTSIRLSWAIGASSHTEAELEPANTVLRRHVRCVQLSSMHRTSLLTATICHINNAHVFGGEMNVPGMGKESPRYFCEVLSSAKDERTIRVLSQHVVLSPQESTVYFS